MTDVCSNCEGLIIETVGPRRIQKCSYYDEKLIQDKSECGKREEREGHQDNVSAREWARAKRNKEGKSLLNFNDWSRQNKITILGMIVTIVVSAASLYVSWENSGQAQEIKLSFNQDINEIKGKLVELETVQDQPNISTEGDGNMNFVKVVEQLTPSIVRILSLQGQANNPLMSESIMMDGIRYSSGSGFIVDPRGLIITAAHVVVDSEMILVSVTDEEGNQSVYDANIINLNQTSDVAVIKINGINLPSVKLGNSEDIKLGNEMAFLGYPVVLNNQPAANVLVVHRGIISSKTKAVFIEDGVVDAFSINAFVNPGNSGGPVFLSDTGEVIGLVNARKPTPVKPEDLLRLPPGYSPGMTIGGVDPLSLSVELYNRNVLYVGEVSQVGIGISVPVDYITEAIGN